MAGYARSQRSIVDQDTKLDVAIEGSIREIRRRREDRLAVGDHRLGVEYARGAVKIE